MSDDDYDAEYSRRAERALAEARRKVASPYTLGTITVAVQPDSYSSDHHAPYVRGECAVCGAECVQAGRYRADMRSLALAIARTFCAGRGHVQDYEALCAGREVPRVGDEVTLDAAMPLAMSGVRRGWITAVDVPVHGVRVATGEQTETPGVRVRLDMDPCTETEFIYAAVTVAARYGERA